MTMEYDNFHDFDAGVNDDDDDTVDEHNYMVYTIALTPFLYLWQLMNEIFMQNVIL